MLCFILGILPASEPYPHCVIRNFIKDTKFVDDLQNALLKLEYYQKNNDLYKFEQVSAGSC